MALSRGEVVGYDAEQMVFRFTMLESASIVDCQISGSFVPRARNLQIGWPSLPNIVKQSKSLQPNCMSLGRAAPSSYASSSSTFADRIISHVMRCVVDSCAGVVEKQKDRPKAILGIHFSGGMASGGPI